jgi:hypothetical protein
MESGHAFGHSGPRASRFVDPVGRDGDEASARRGQGEAHRGQGEGGLKREDHVGSPVGFDLKNGARRGKVSAARRRWGEPVEDWETFRR